MSGAASEADLIRVVLADANVLYSRVLRDYLLYAADQEIVAIASSSHILDEVTEHLMENVEGFDHAAAQRLVSAMNRAFPYAEVEPDEEHWRMLDEVSLVPSPRSTRRTSRGVNLQRALTPDQLLSRLWENRSQPVGPWGLTRPRSFRDDLPPLT
jgi:hypothetical protein